MNTETKVNLFKTYCYPLYCGSLWSEYRLSTMSCLRVGYNSILRRLLGIRLWNPELERVVSMTELFLDHDVKSFPDLFKSWRKDMGREHTAFKSDREVRNKTGSEGVVCYRPKTNPRSKQRLMAEIRSDLENHWPFHIQCTGNVDFITISMKINPGTMSNLFNQIARWYNYWKWIYRDPRRKPWSHPTQLEKGTVMTW